MYDILNYLSALEYLDFYLEQVHDNSVLVQCKIE